jgi:hypothetical protein
MSLIPSIIVDDTLVLKSRTGATKPSFTVLAANRATLLPTTVPINSSRTSKARLDALPTSARIHRSTVYYFHFYIIIKQYYLFWA